MSSNPAAPNREFRRVAGVLLGGLLTWGLVSLADTWGPLVFPWNVLFALVGVLGVIVLWMILEFWQRPDQCDVALATLRRCDRCFVRLLALLDRRLPPKPEPRRTEGEPHSGDDGKRASELSPRAREAAQDLNSRLADIGSQRLDTLFGSLVQWLRLAPADPGPAVGSTAPPAPEDMKRALNFCASRWPAREDWLRGMVGALLGLLVFVLPLLAVLYGVGWLLSLWKGVPLPDRAWQFVFPMAGLLFLWSTLELTWSGHRGEKANYLDAQIKGLEPDVDMLGVLLDRRVPEELRTLLQPSDQLAYAKFIEALAAWQSSTEGAGASAPPWWRIAGTEARLQSLVDHLEAQRS